MAISRRRFLINSAVVVTGVGTFGYARFIEPRWLHVEQLEVVLSSLQSSVRILHLSDLHYSAVVSLGFLQEAFDIGLQQDPDLICLTGDYITAGDRRSATNLQSLLSEVSKTKPTFAVLGNHDGGPWSAGMGGSKTPTAVVHMLEGAGVELLQNRMHTIDVGKNTIQLVGLDDMWSGNPDAKEAFSGTVGSTPTIVLSHNPDSKNLFADYDWDLLLSGHTHGGQVVIPLYGPPFVPIQDKRFTSGLNEWRGKKVFTSKGVGNLHGIRFNCPPEIAVLHLEPQRV